MTHVNCSTCKWWQDYNDRVYARVRFKQGTRERGIIELRRCKNDPPPTVQSAQSVYTDPDFSCSGWVMAEKP